MAARNSASGDCLDAILEAARPFLRGELEAVDPELPKFAAVLRSVGAGECWHKHGTFYSHLLEVYRILKLWGAPDDVARCGLFHSAYSNSYVNLAIFDPGTEREHVRGIVGLRAECLIHLFCIVPRQSLIHDDLLFHYTDEDLVEHLKQSEDVYHFASADEPWRRKIRSLVPPEGIKVKHIRTGEDVLVSRRMVAIFVLMTMADFSDQLYQWQDELFDNGDGRLEFHGNNFAALWPGEGKPGLWMSSISRMGALYKLIAREEDLHVKQRQAGSSIDGRDEEIELALPPVFDFCSKILDPGEQIAARDLYWKAVCSNADDDWDTKVEKMLRESSERNPFVGEPHLILAQVMMNTGRYEEAEREAEAGLRLVLQWGSSWDKRMTWEGWVSWGRVLLTRARQRDWPTTSWGILNLGLVR